MQAFQFRKKEKKLRKRQKHDRKAIYETKETWNNDNTAIPNRNEKLQEKKIERETLSGKK